MKKNIPVERDKYRKCFFYPGFLIIGLKTKRANFKGNTDNQKLKTLMLTVGTQNLSAFMFYAHDWNNDTILNCILKQFCAVYFSFLIVHEKLLLTDWKLLLHKGNHQGRCSLKPGCSVEFCRNFLVDIIVFQVLKRSSIFILFEVNWFINNDWNLFAIDLITASK